MQNTRRDLIAYVAPFAIFMAFLALEGLIQKLFSSTESLLLSQPKYWIFPLQTAVCAGLLAWFWKCYRFQSVHGSLRGIAAGLLALIIWISPQVAFGVPPRVEGFNPEVFAGSWLYTLTLIARFARLIIVVPLLEEVFWRGFLMRYLIDDKFTSVPFGTFRPFPFAAVAVLFMLAHLQADWIPALLTGIIYNALAVRTKSLWACVIAHAVTNLGLGIYIMTTKQWGFW